MGKSVADVDSINVIMRGGIIKMEYDVIGGMIYGRLWLRKNKQDCAFLFLLILM